MWYRLLFFKGGVMSDEKTIELRTIKLIVDQETYDEITELCKVLNATESQFIINAIYSFKRKVALEIERIEKRKGNKQ